MNKKQIISKFHEKGNVEMSTIERLMGMDNTPTKKYAGYIINQVTRNNEMPSRVVRVCEDFEKYLPHLENKDIYSARYRWVWELESTIGKVKEDIQKKKIKKEKEKLIFILEENDDYILLQPRSFEASQKYGYGTRWCTTSSNRHFENYKDYLVYLIFKKPDEYGTREKVAFFARNGDFSEVCVYNSADNDIWVSGFRRLVPKSSRILRKVKRFYKRDRRMWWKGMNKNSFYSRDKEEAKRMKRIRESRW